MRTRNRILLALLLLGLALRLWFIAANVIDARFSAADDGDYYQRALRFAASGEYVDNSWLIRPPGHVLMFAALLRFAIAIGEPNWGQALIRGVHVALSLWGILLGYGLARRLFGPGPGYAFALLLAVWFPMVELPALILSEPLFFFLLLLHLYLLIRWRDERAQPRGGRWLVASGATLGLCALARSIGLYAAAFAALYVILEVWQARGDTRDLRPDTPDEEALTRRAHALGVRVSSPTRLRASLSRGWAGDALKSVVVFGLACVLVIAPWTARNYIAYGRFIPVDTLGPVNLWLALYSENGEGEGKGILSTVPQADRQAFVTRQIREAIVSDPARLLRNAWPHFRHIWKAQFIEDFWVKASFYTRPLRAVWPIGLAGDALWLVYTVGGLVALAAPLRWRAGSGERRNSKRGAGSGTVLRSHAHTLTHSHDGPFRALVLCWLAYSALTVMLLHIEPRYLLPIWLLMGLYGSWALGAPRALFAAMRARPLNAALAAGLVLAFAYLFVSYRDYPDVIARGVTRERLIAQGQAAYDRGDYPAAEREFRAAVELHPYFIDGRTELALALVAQRRYDDALVALANGDTHRANVVRGAIARAAGDRELAATYFEDAEFRAGEDIQALTLQWLRPPATNDLALGDGLDFGYVLGFSPGEQMPDGAFTYRWLQGDGRVVLPLEKPLRAGDALELRMAGGPDGPTPLDVTVGGVRTALAVTTGQWRVYRVMVPAELAGQGRVEVQLHAPTFIPAHDDPASTDTRPLSLMLSAVRVR